MWRFFRFGIKSNNCSGNQAHFRVIGTTCGNAECDDEKIDEGSDAPFNKENIPTNCKENFASKAAQEHQNFLKYNSSKQHSTRILPNGADKLKSLQDSLSQIQWQQYLIQREKSFTPEGKKGGKQALYVKKKRKKNSSFAEAKSQTEAEEEEKFGSLSKIDRKFEYIPEEKEELKYLLKDQYEQKFEAQSYGHKMLVLCKERKLKEALDVLEVEMKVQNVAPNEYCYNVLINACGKAGYAKKAFELYNQLKQRCLKVQKFAYTGLFNACANTPFKEEGLESARRLRKELKNKEKSLSPISYHAMIKAFGHCGDIEAAFEIADEMLDERHVVSTETMNFLLQACISDRENGFRHALMVWRRMRALKITPCLYSYNLLLRCVKECQAGDTQLVSNILEGFEPSKHERQSKKKESRQEAETLTFVEESVRVKPAPPLEKSGEAVHQEGSHVRTSPSSSLREDEKNEDRRRSICQIPEGDEVVRVNLAENMELEIVSSKLPVPAEDTRREEALPDVLGRKFSPGKVASITSLQTRVDRLWLLGGIAGVVENMMKDRVKPTVISFTHLLDSLPLTYEAEEGLLSAMKTCKVVPDVIFCNKLIRVRAFRSLAEAKEVLELMQKHLVLVDLITFGCLAIGCRRPSEMDTFFRDMDSAGFAPNEEIMETLLKNCMNNSEFGYSIDLLKRMRSLRLKPNENILHTLEETRKLIRERTVRHEINESPASSFREKRIREEMKLFLMEYKHWLKKSKVELKDHPWTQFGYEDGGRQVAKVS